MNGKLKISLALRTAVTTSVLFAGVILWSTLSFGVTSTIADVRANIRDEVREIIQSIDPEAIVAVDVVPEVLPKTKLPGTNVTLDETNLAGDGGLPKIKSVSIIVLTEIKKLPADTEKVIKTNLAMYTKDVRVSLQARLIGAKNKIQNIAVDFDPLQKSISPLQGSIDGITNQFAKGFFVLVGAACLIFLPLLFIGYQNRLHVREIRASTQSFVQALESFSGGGGGGNQSMQTLERAPQQLLGAGGKTTDLFAEMSDAGIAAIISDAYWCEEDGYAAAVWQRLPLARKQVLLSGLPFGKEYANYLSTVPEREGIWEQHPYYLNPLPIWKISNAALAQQVKDAPSLIGMLSPMRLTYIPMDSSEILTLRHVGSKVTAGVIDFSKIPDSPLRQLGVSTRIASRNDDDDMKLLSMTDVDLADMQEIITLVWVMQVGDERLKALVKDLSAADLASAWIGPDIVLEKLEKALAPKKLKILKSYQGKIRPSRESAFYQLMHRVIVDEIKNGAETRETGVDENEMKISA